MGKNPRGVLQRVVRRIIDKKNGKQRCELACGHAIERSTGQLSERGYCTECKPAETELERASRLAREKRKRRKKIRKGII
jgi:hypothetical protein